MWPFRRNTQDFEDSEQAILNARKELREVKSRTHEVHEVSGALRNFRERNHFAEQLRAIMHGR